MFNKLIKLANKLDAMGEYELADAIDAIVKEAVELKPMRFVDKRPEEEREQDITGPFDEYFRGPRKEMQARPGEQDPRRYIIDEEGTHEELREHDKDVVPEDKLKPEFKGKKEDVDPDQLSMEDVPTEYLVERLEPNTMQDFEEEGEEALDYRKLWE